jgi:hypothetical protein
MANEGEAAQTHPDIAIIDLSAFGATYKQRKGLGRITLVIVGVIAAIAVFALAVLLAYLGYLIAPRYETEILVVILVTYIVVLIGGALVMFRQQTRYRLGYASLLDEKSLSPGDIDRTVPGAGVPLRELIRRVRAFSSSLGSSARVKENDPAKLAKARNTRLIGIGVIVIGLLVALFLSIQIGLVMVMLSGFIFVRAAQAAQPSIERVREVDKRRPILLLRSFRDDKLVAPERRRYGPFVVNAIRRFEQQIADSFQELGPLIAIGEPGEKVPQLGAARSYLANDQWQAAVLGWIEEAMMIVMIAGTTEWIRWELHRILEKGRDAHLVILLPPDRWQFLIRGKSKLSTRQQRWANVLASFAGTAWAGPLGALDITNVLLVQLEPGGRITAIKADSVHVQAYQLAIMVAVDDEFVRPQQTDT